MRILSSSANRIDSVRRQGLQVACAFPSLYRSRQAFSLVEILTVLAVISIMAAVSLPSITSMSQSSSLAAGGNDLADLAALAHDYATSHNVMTALVGVKNAGSVSTAQQYRAFVVMASDSTGSNWTPVSKWMFLPASVTLASKSNLSTFLTTSSVPPLNNPDQSPLTLHLGGSSFNGNYAWQMFYPDGHMATSASSVALYIVPNQMNQTFTTTVPKDYYELIFNPMTGTVKVNRP